MLKECTCRGCGAKLYRIKPLSQRRSIPVDTEEQWIKKDPKGFTYVTESGTYVIGNAVGESYDNDLDLIIAYKPHLPDCPQNGRAPRKHRDRSKGEKDRCIDYAEKKE